MNPNNSTSDNRLRKNLLIIFITIVLTIILYQLNPWNIFGFHTTSYSSVDSIDTASVVTAFKGDSIPLAKKKVSTLDFLNDYSTNQWYSEFEQNKVAFDKNYKDQKLDMWGIIGNIDNEYDCAMITLQINDGMEHRVVCSNCPENTDKWASEVIKQSVGDTIHVRGFYDSSLSGDGEIDLYKCHIIK